MMRQSGSMGRTYMRCPQTLWERPVIAHISIGVRDIDRSKGFYDTVLEPLGYKCLRAARTLLGYGYGRESIAFWVVSAERPVSADEKSGLHVCFRAPNSDAVDPLQLSASDCSSPPATPWARHRLSSGARSVSSCSRTFPRRRRRSPSRCAATRTPGRLISKIGWTTARC